MTEAAGTAAVAGWTGAMIGGNIGKLFGFPGAAIGGAVGTVWGVFFGLSD